MHQQPIKTTARSTSTASETDPINRLGALLVVRGHCDARTIERGRRMADESGQRLDAVLIQLGLVSERALADAYSVLLALPLATPDR